ncbi:MAG: hypothetical protein E2O35_01270 [Proteobacteria bacterium]|nr:MAG: hypothetical protein E2O35_01270 [Pseudomonadota bacterium]
MTAADGLLPEEYDIVVAPAMRAAAELAAARGDPYLYNDLACMLTLMVMVRGLADLYQDQWGALGQTSARAVFSAAPRAACVMVLTEYELDSESIGAMIAALDHAYAQLAADKVFGPESVPIQKAWDAQSEQQFDRAHAYMRQAATSAAAAIDAWEGRRVVSKPD